MSIFPTVRTEWAQQKAALEQRIAAKHRELEAAERMERVAYIQGEIATLRWLLGEAEPVHREGAGKARYS